MSFNEWKEKSDWLGGVIGWLKRGGGEIMISRRRKGKEDWSRELNERLQMGEELITALISLRGVFNELEGTRLWAYWEAGELESGLEAIRDEWKSRHLALKSIRGAMAYPLLLAVTFALVWGFIDFWVLPKMDDFMSTQFNAGNEDSGRRWGIFILNGFPIFTGVGILVGVVFWTIHLGLFRQWKGYALGWATFWGGFPWVNQWIRIGNEKELVKSLGVLMRSGIGWREACAALEKRTNRWDYRVCWRNLGGAITEGESLVRSMESYLPLRMSTYDRLFTAEQNGILADAMVEIGQEAEALHREIIENAVQWVTPIFLFLMTGLILLLISTLFVPMISMFENLAR